MVEVRDGSSDEKSEDTVQSSDLEFLDDGTQAPVQSVGFYQRSLLSQPASVHALSCCHKLMRLLWLQQWSQRKKSKSKSTQESEDCSTEDYDS